MLLIAQVAVISSFNEVPAPSAHGMVERPCGPVNNRVCSPNHEDQFDRSLLLPIAQPVLPRRSFGAAASRRATHLADLPLSGSDLETPLGWAYWPQGCFSYQMTD
jgi:hypothetical protein